MLLKEKTHKRGVRMHPLDEVKTIEINISPLSKTLFHKKQK